MAGSSTGENPRNCDRFSLDFPLRNKREHCSIYTYAPFARRPSRSPRPPSERRNQPVSSQTTAYSPKRPRVRARRVVFQPVWAPGAVGVYGALVLPMVTPVDTADNSHRSPRTSAHPRY
jgi:hypothetical protein